CSSYVHRRVLHSFPPRRSSDLGDRARARDRAPRSSGGPCRFSSSSCCRAQDARANGRGLYTRSAGRGSRSPQCGAGTCCWFGSWFLQREVRRGSHRGPSAEADLPNRSGVPGVEQVDSGPLEISRVPRHSRRTPVLRYSPSFLFSSSLTACGLAFPPVAFMTWPTNQPTAWGLALACSTLSGLAAITLSTAASMAPVSVTCLRPRFSTISAGSPPSLQTISNTSLAILP